MRAEALEIADAYRDGRIKLLTPDLLWPESGNAFWKAVRQRRMLLADAEAAIRTLREMNIPAVPAIDLLDRAFSIATAFGHPVYDCIYIALAACSRAPLITADENLAMRFSARFPVRWLGSMEIAGCAT